MIHTAHINPAFPICSDSQTVRSQGLTGRLDARMTRSLHRQTPQPKPIWLLLCIKMPLVVYSITLLCNSGCYSVKCIVLFKADQLSCQQHFNFIFLDVVIFTACSQHFQRIKALPRWEGVLQCFISYSTSFPHYAWMLCDSRWLLIYSTSTLPLFVPM